jgi:hypothetical protein
MPRRRLLPTPRGAVPPVVPATVASRHRCSKASPCFVPILRVRHLLFCTRWKLDRPRHRSSARESRSSPRSRFGPWYRPYGTRLDLSQAVVQLSAPCGFPGLGRFPIDAREQLGRQIEPLLRAQRECFLEYLSCGHSHSKMLSRLTRCLLLSVERAGGSTLPRGPRDEGGDGGAPRSADPPGQSVRRPHDRQVLRAASDDRRPRRQRRPDRPARHPIIAIRDVMLLVAMPAEIGELAVAPSFFRTYSRHLTQGLLDRTTARIRGSSSCMSAISSASRRCRRRASGWVRSSGFAAFRTSSSTDCSATPTPTGPQLATRQT